MVHAMNRVHRWRSHVGRPLPTSIGAVAARQRSLGRACEDDGEGGVGQRVGRMAKPAVGTGSSESGWSSGRGWPDLGKKMVRKGECLDLLVSYIWLQSKPDTSNLFALSFTFPTFQATENIVSNKPLLYFPISFWLGSSKRSSHFS